MNVCSNLSSYIKPELEEKYQKLWKRVANYFIQHGGTIDSCLPKTEDGIWLAYSRWRDCGVATAIVSRLEEEAKNIALRKLLHTQALQLTFFRKKGFRGCKRTTMVNSGKS